MAVGRTAIQFSVRTQQRQQQGTRPCCAVINLINQCEGQQESTKTPMRCCFVVSKASSGSNKQTSLSLSVGLKVPDDRVQARLRRAVVYERD